MKKEIHCTLKINSFEKRMLFPKLQDYCTENKISVKIQEIKPGVYRLYGVAGESRIEECSRELVRLSRMFPGRVDEIRVMFPPESK